MKESISYVPKIANNTLLFILFIAMIEDYIITYVGVNILGVIEEANYLMKGLFNLPMYIGLQIRIIMAIIPLLLLKYVEDKCPRRIKYDLILKFLLFIQLIVFSMHGIWIYKYYIINSLKI